MKKMTTGLWGEQLARSFLEDLGYVLCEENFSSPFGEIDIIAQDQQCLCFVEVRTRQMESDVHPIETISIQKQRRLWKTAQVYLQQHDLGDVLCRFDAVTVMFNDEQGIQVDHYKNILMEN